MRICKNCGLEMNRQYKESKKKWERRLYCSRKCSDARQFIRAEKTCATCNTTYERPRGYDLRQWKERINCFACKPRGAGFTHSENFVPTSRIRPYIMRELESGTPIEAIEKMTGIADRRIRCVIQMETAVTSFRTADKIITGLVGVQAWYQELSDIYQTVRL